MRKSAGCIAWFSVAIRPPRKSSGPEVSWSGAAASETGWDQLSQGLLLANEFVFID